MSQRLKDGNLLVNQSIGILLTVLVDILTIRGDFDGLK